MTIDNPIPNVGGGPELQQKFGNSIGMFQEYSCPPPYPPGGAADHSLQQEVLLQSPSPCGVSMYEHEHSDKQTALLSPCSNISGCGSEFGWYDDGLSVKQEPVEENYFNFNKTLPCDEGWFENLQSDPLWSPGADSGVFKMEDVFQVDQSTVNCGPTLAQLNSPAEITAMMEEMDRRESWRVPQVSPTAPLPWQCATQTSLPCQTQANVHSYIKTENASQTTGSDPSQISTMNLQAVPAPVVQSLIAGLTGQSVGAASTAAAEPAQNETVQGRSASYAAGEVTQTVTPLVNHVRPLKRPAPDSQENSLDSKWEEIKQFIHSDLEQRQHEASSKQSHGKDIAYTPNEDIDSNDEGFGSDSCDSDVDDGNMCSDYSSDAESVDSVWHLLSDSRTSKKKKKRFFWQYNTQAKGPKGKRLCNTLREVDPHVLNDFSDPVFDPSVGDMKYKHSGKARRGEGNDVTPNPKKLFQIGNELKKLNRQIHDIAPAGDLPSTSRPKSRREKNKLASRACRLKKKAQHEAFKIKLHGLEMEHSELMQVIASVKQLLAKQLREPSKASSSSMVEQCTMLEDKYWNNKVAHKTTEYVNTVIEQVAKGDATGGLGKLSII